MPESATPEPSSSLTSIPTGRPSLTSDVAHLAGGEVETLFLQGRHISRPPRRARPPHDNAVVAAGFARYGLMKEAEAVFSALYDASLFFDLHRLPELFCGFRRRAGEGPTHYPVSCSPQTWASASVFLFLQSMLGLTVRGAESEAIFSHPVLPAFLPEVRLTGLRVGGGRVDLQLERHERDVGVNVLERDGDIQVLVVK